MGDLLDRHAIVTGAGSGLGQAIACAFAAAGARLTLLDSDAKGLAATALRINGVAAAVQKNVDVTNSSEVGTAIGAAAAAHGSISIVVNCAGIIVRRGFAESDAATWRRVLDVNVIGYVNVLQAALPFMEGDGSVIQVASSTAHRGGHGYASYSASKGAVLALTRHLAGELAPRGIRVNSISPGPTATALNRDVFASEDAVRSIVGAVPLGRIGVPEDVVGAALFLAGPNSRYVTGIDVCIDGGLTSQVQLTTGAAAYTDYRSAS